MGDKPIWEQIGSSFIQHYYQLFDNDRTQLGAIYIDASCLTWEGQQFQGKAAIVEKLSSLPFQKIQHSITAQDHQPTPDSCIISMVVGQLKADEDPIMGFHQMFLLKNINDAWVCTNDMFRLALHNFGTHAVSSSLQFLIIFTLLQMVQISYTNKQSLNGGSGRSALLLLRCCA
ncbi:nuclear transport factor 2-like [Erinaceus europaeus]|nr:nuclear transport factor 2-like [Erinaceus europaeus]